MAEDLKKEQKLSDREVLAREYPSPGTSNHLGR